ncbi:MAG: FAD/NAD(P)-binding oxidoreductase [Alphaproteobacteria bacterium]|nr:FAD/NAD(P)-binding oxidoreductase [Alphaproteobacteria bacterium]
MAAAIAARRHGLSVLALDEQAAPGGQIWRAIEANAARSKTLDADYAAGLATVHSFRSSGAEALFGASVWNVDTDGSVIWSRDGVAASANGKRVLLATGAIERAMPIAGWQLPGVLTVGAAQILLKTSGLRPKGRVWLAGQGPLLRLYAAQAIAAGGALAGVIDLQPVTTTRAAFHHLPAALSRWRDLLKGLRWKAAVRHAGVPWLAATAIAAHGDGRLSEVHITTRAGERREPADLLLLHDGVVPSVQISRALGLAHDWHAAQRCWHPRIDAAGRTSEERILIAGDGAGIAGALAAVEAGTIAGLAVAQDLGRVDAAACVDEIAGASRRRAAYVGMRPLLDALFPPLPVRPADDTIICRCEEVTAGRLREAAKLGCLGPNQLKTYSRCGMGPCQGRNCGLAVSEIIAEARGVPVEEVGYLRQRFPTKPVTLGELAAMWERK